MIEKIGVKTLIEEPVAYKALEPGEDETAEAARFSGFLYRMGAGPRDPQMVVYYGPPGEGDTRKEVLIPIENPVEGVDWRMMPALRVAFLVYIGAQKSVDHYYRELEGYIEGRGLKRGEAFYSIEAIYQPDEFNLSVGSLIDEDTPEYWRNELMIPVEE